MNPPPPLHWDPHYDDRPWLLEWLTDEDEHSVVAVLEPIKVNFRDSLLGTAITTTTLAKRRAAGPAPYVGLAFRYEWWVATDDEGRSIAGPAKMVHFIPPVPDYMTVPWYPQKNDLIGGWCVMPVDAPPGEVQAPEVADFVTEEIARHVAQLHNDWLKANG